MIPLHTEVAEHGEKKECGSYEVVKSRLILFEIQNALMVPIH